MNKIIITSRKSHLHREFPSSWVFMFFHLHTRYYASSNMDSIVRPQVEKEKNVISKELSERLENFKSEQWIGQAWLVALQKFLSNAKMSPRDDNSPGMRKDLEKAWSPFLLGVIDSCFEDILTEVSGKKYINTKKDVIGVILFPPIWQSAVDQYTTSISGSTPCHHVTAADSDGSKLKSLLPASVIKACNERILYLLTGPEIWGSLSSIRDEVLLIPLRKVADQGYIETLHFVDERGDFLIQDSVMPVNTFSMGKPTFQTFKHDCMTQFSQGLRSNLCKEGGRNVLATNLGVYTRKFCRDMIISGAFEQEILPAFAKEVQDILDEEKDSKKAGKVGLFGRVLRRNNRG